MNNASEVCDRVAVALDRLDNETGFDDVDFVNAVRLAIDESEWCRSRLSHPGLGAHDMTTAISASTHTAIDDGQVLWIIARPHATVLAELIAVDAADKGRDKETEDPNEAYGAYCGEHPAVAEFFNARKIRDKYDLPAVRYVTGRGWS